MIKRTISLNEDSGFLNACRTISGLFGCKPDDLLFYDIETTGLSPRDSYIYLIGCEYLDNGVPVFTQFFSEGPADEENLLAEFEGLLCKHTSPVDYNGSSFDMPFLSARAAHYGKELTFEGEEIDIYRLLRPYKDFFGLRSLRLKAVEQFVGINRRDMYDGKELIDMYIRYVASKKVEQLRKNADAALPPSKNIPAAATHDSVTDTRSGLRLLNDSDSNQLLRLLLLHNEEDVLNMPHICTLLDVIAFLRGEFTVESVTISADAVILLTPGNEKCVESLKRIFTSKSPSRNTLQDVCSREYGITLPSGASFSVWLKISNDRNIELILRSIEGELKLFFPDYKNYYYLINEDYAVHKSIGSFMDKSVCIKCSASNCYTRKSGLFLPVPEKNGGDLKDLMYLYRKDAKDKICYILADDLPDRPEATYCYIRQLLSGLKM